MKYNFNEIEAKWQKYWAENGTFHAEDNSDKPKYYVLDMFPYPSGAGLHVGHPLGYIASDIYARYKRHQGFNVLHPQGYDSFGLPAEQYAIQTGQHPAITTKTNIARYREQLDKIGFSFDWSREVRTSDPAYYKWTQWIFIELFNSWYNVETDKAEHIDTLVAKFETDGNANVKAICDDDTPVFASAEWTQYDSKTKQEILLKYRLTYLAETEVNWCPALGTVLANDEIVNGVSERGGHPVVRKKMTQWSMRISAYAQRLLDGLNTIDWPQALMDSQTHWIGRSQGAMVTFKVDGHDANIDVFTTRPDTIYGVSFMTLAPEHDLVAKITTEDQKEAVQAYVEATSKRSERERMADVKTISGVFTGAHALHPFTGEKVQIWIGDYVLASYGTGAVMAVPCGDQRDYDFAKHFGLDIPNIFEGVDISEEAHADKEGTKIANSDFLNGLTYKKAMKTVIYEMEKRGFGKGKINYRLRDAVFSRQRYWGEPFPVYYVNGMPQMIDVKHLPITLPEVEKYLPTETGEPPLGNAEFWAWDTNTNTVVDNDKIDNETIFPLELNTMPGWAGSSWYFFRYMEKAAREDNFASEEALKYWGNVDLYIGGSEHATGHLLYARFWTKFLKDRGFVNVDEPFKKLINQGMILGTSAFVYKVYSIPLMGKKSTGNFENSTSREFYSSICVSSSIVEKIESGTLSGKLDDEIMRLLKKQIKNANLDLSEKDKYTSPIGFRILRYHIDVSLVNSANELDTEGFKNWRADYKDAEFICEEDGTFKVSREVEKMSKSKYNVVNPDDICEAYGADSLRLFEMFLGPLEQAKPWNTAGITGVFSFLKKLWKLYITDEGPRVTETEPTKDNLKTLHKTIKKVQEDIENFSFNTSVSTFMICVNELTDQKCTSRAILEPLTILVSPYAPHIAEELWERLGNEGSIVTAKFPIFEPKHLVESSKEYPVSFNGKMRFKKELSLDLSKEEIEKIILEDERTQAQLAGRTPKKVIVVPGKIINIVG
ncbi:class I tRNA ligase family protein [Kordia algicida OT-1]|uniref:Leucine--tRNA ligase n=1 Tax=Kordia algicida OT-1 TaxID=391587 RepID=A9DKZ7_9FLAO|nr:class I tRNA ligase family protein [Kordia algicida]EDP98440.1 leucyl-tRNA synthetase [Kordia algicida OT-1]